MRLRYTPRARSDISQIYSYIARHNPRAASAVVRQIRSTAQWLVRHPGLGRETDIADIRMFPTARYPYLVYHRVIAGELVVIHGRDGGRDAPDERDL